MSTLKLNNDVHERAQEIITYLVEKGLFSALEYKVGPYGFWSNSLDKWIHKNHNLFLEEEGIELFSGATKVCVTCMDLDWVIKFNIPDHPGKEQTDYCEIEYKNYLAAIDNGVEEYFAAMVKGGVEYGIQLYFQQYAEPNEDRISNSLYEYAASISSGKEEDENEDEYTARICDVSDDLDDDERLLAIFDDVSTANLARLIDFTEEYDINDLHCGNYGVLKDGRIVIIDYSGYNG